MNKKFVVCMFAIIIAVFVMQKGVSAQSATETPTPTPEDLLVFYIPAAAAWEERCSAMLEAGFSEVPAFNPYWAQRGRTFQDQDGYRIVLQQTTWAP